MRKDAVNKPKESHMFEAYFTATIGILFFMFAFWLLYLKTGEPSVVDIAWTLSIGGLSFYFFYLGPKNHTAQWLIVVTTLFWSLRVAYVLLERMIRGQKDGRYKILSNIWQKGLHWKYLLFYLAQGIGSLILLLPIAFVMILKTGPWHSLDTLATIWLICSLIGEAVADASLRQFRHQPENKGKVCQQGLWYYSRHPNYFFQWNLWVSYALFASSVPFGFIGWISPLIMLYLLLYVTGIPPNEKQSLLSRGEAYRDYQKTTSAFIPLPKRKVL